MSTLLAAALEAELAWLEGLWRWRLGDHFERSGAGGPLPLDAEPPPSWPADLPPLGPDTGVGDDAAVARDVRALRALALLPWLRPRALDMLFARHEPGGRGFTEFGGLSQGSAFLPTGETACFLLGGDSLAQRLRSTALMCRLAAQDDGAWLSLAEAAAGEPAWAGAWRPGPRLLAAVFGAADLVGGPVAPMVALPLHTRLHWADLVLPALTLAQLDEIHHWLQHRTQLLEEWGLAARLRPGYTALFHGPPGTGKTLSAALLGQRCGRTVMRIDLAAVVSKYIGETEKNLARVFDEAEREGWILFFDEADALFGKRSRVSDAHDRYANQEVSYLLQRIEDYPGVVLLASNLRSNIDEAFQRRFQSVLHFAMPRPPERLRLWREALPAALRHGPGVDLAALAERHEIAGGTIMNAVRLACLRAAQRGDGLLRAEDLDEGVRRELVKEGRAL